MAVLRQRALSLVMAGLVPAIHVLWAASENVDARHKAGHDGTDSAHTLSSWPGSSRPSTFSGAASENVDALHEAGA